MIFKGLRISQLGVRLIHTAIKAEGANKAALSKLRKKTGYPFINCKKALTKFDNDLAQAEAWLKEQAQKEGWAKATKLQGRHMSHGLVGLLVEKNTAALVEVNCETDFVARNVQFQKLVRSAAAACFNSAQNFDGTKSLLDGSSVNQLTATSDNKTLADLVALEVGNIGENMAIRRAAIFKTTDNVNIGYYIHGTGSQIEKEGKCMLGKYGALVTFSQLDNIQPEIGIAELGRQLGQHVIGMNPQSVGKLEEPVTAEQESESVELEGSKSEEKNEDGEQEKPKEETRMVYQEFLLDADLTVGQFLQQNSCSVLDFVRFECGEELSSEQS